MTSSGGSGIGVDRLPDEKLATLIRDTARTKAVDHQRDLA
jgi:hypothetical protein